MCSSFTFLQFPMFFPCLGSGLVNIQWLGSLLGIFVLISTVGNFIVLVALRMEEKIYEFWVVVEVVLDT